MASQYTVLPFIETTLSEKKWNGSVEISMGGTIFHRLDFLAYHKDRFLQNERHLIILKGEELCGLMPMAIFEESAQKIAKSPYGASYGGPIFPKKLTYSESGDVLDALLETIKRLGIRKLTITFPISPVYAVYCDTFRLCMYERGFVASNRDISSVVTLGGTREQTEKSFESRGRNMARKAEKLGIKIVPRADLELFWPVLARTYQKHAIPPTHSKDELCLLTKTFPDRIFFDVAVHENKSIAGIGYFVINARVNSSFYLANDPDCQQLQGVSLLVSEALGRASEEGFKYFDFGTSSVAMHGRDNLFRFKESFGAGGCFRDTFVWEAEA